MDVPCGKGLPSLLLRTIAESGGDLFLQKDEPVGNVLQRLNDILPVDGGVLRNVVICLPRLALLVKRKEITITSRTVRSVSEVNM